MHGEIVMATLIEDWEDLSKVPPSDTHRIYVDGCSGFVWCRETNKPIHYLSTHTFYGNQHEASTKKLQSFGFNVEIANWDADYN